MSKPISLLPSESDLQFLEICDFVYSRCAAAGLTDNWSTFGSYKLSQLFPLIARIPEDIDFVSNDREHLTELPNIASNALKPSFNDSVLVCHPITAYDLKNYEGVEGVVLSIWARLANQDHNRPLPCDFAIDADTDRATLESPEYLLATKCFSLVRNVNPPGASISLETLFDIWLLATHLKINKVRFGKVLLDLFHEVDALISNVETLSLLHKLSRPGSICPTVNTVDRER